MNSLKNSVILVPQNGMGQGAPELQIKLAATYFKMLAENDYSPGAVCFYNEGVRLILNDSPILDSLAALEAQGTRLIICNTCLKFYNLADRVAVGIIGGMHDIVESQRIAEKVITI